MIEVVSATRHDEKSFWEKSALGLSLRRMSFDVRLEYNITLNNSVGLGEIYNHRINSESTSDILLFVHDDVWIEDFFLADRLIEGLENYDVIGVAGNRRRVPLQKSWASAKIGDKVVMDKDNISGAVAHGIYPFAGVSFFGVPASCELLDGVFLASKRSKLKKANVVFDPQFKFHFYDIDFCRTARHNGLTIGTWPIAITHQSWGDYSGYENAYSLYIRKWKD